jgi:dihydropteroate synthase
VILRLRDTELELRPGHPVLMGIVNAGPDSFSDPGSRGLPELMAHAEELVAAGATIVDVGGESGRTDRRVVSEGEEIARVVPLIARLAGRGVLVSVDTWRAPVAGAALEAGAAMVNDVSGLSDPAVAEACAKAGAALVLTHTRIPPKRKGFPIEGDVVEDVRSLLSERAPEARRRGMDDERLVFDPGIDLAKTPAQSVEVLRRLPEIAELGRPLLLAVSRKDVVGALTGRPPRERLAGTLAAVGAAADGCAAILRVHDVAEVADYLRVRSAARGETEVPVDLELPKALRREPVAEPGDDGPELDVAALDCRQSG